MNSGKAADMFRQDHITSTALLNAHFCKMGTIENREKNSAASKYHIGP
jgi:hypothetical protein